MKEFGLLLFSLCAILLGERKISEEQKRIALLSGFLRLIGAVRCEIEQSRRPIDGIFSSLPQDFLFDGGDFDRILRKSGLACAMNASAALGIAEEERGILNRFSLLLGKSNVGQQLRLCEETEKELSTLSARLSAKLPQKIKLTRLFSLSVPAFALILCL